MFKNVATKIALFAFDTTTGVAKTGDAANLTAYVSKDYGAVTVLGDTSATEMDATNAKGWYLFDVAQAESNADALLFTAKSTTANISIVGQYIHTTPNRFTTLVIDAAGLADANAVKVGPTGAGTAQTAGDIMADTNDIQTRLPAALVGGRMDSSTGAMAANVLTAAAISADAITAAKVADGTIDAATFAAGAINAAAIAADAITAAKVADGTIDAATFAAGAINAAAIAADAITDAKVASDVTIASVTGAVGSVTGAVGSVTGLTASDVGAIKAKTDNLPSDPADQSLIIAATDAIMTRVGAPVGASISADIAGVQADTDNIQTRLPAALVSGRIDASVGAYPGNTAQTGDAFARLGAPAGASVSADVAAVKVDTAAIKAKTDGLPADPADASDIAGAFGTVNGTLATIAGYIDTEVGAIKAKTDNLPASPAATGDIPTAAAIADQVWDEAIAGHLGAGSTGAALNAAGSAGDPWTTPLPGAYGAGTAGKIVGDNINATVSSRASQTSVDTIDDFVDTEVAAIKTKTDFLPSATAGAAGGLFIAGANAATTVNLTGNLTGNVSGSVGSVTADVGITQAGADKVWASAARTLTSFGTLVADVATAVWGAATRILTAGTNIVLAKGVGITGFNDLDAAGVRSAVGLASANLDTQLDALPTNAELATALGTADDAVLAQVALVKAKTDNLPPDPADASDVAAAFSTAASALTVVDGHVLAVKAKTDNLPAAPAAVSDIPTTAAVADKFLGRNIAGGSDGGRMVKDALRPLRNKTGIVGGTLTVMEEDDVTPAWTAAVTTAPGDPLAAVDPA